MLQLRHYSHLIFYWKSHSSPGVGNCFVIEITYNSSLIRIWRNFIRPLLFFFFFLNRYDDLGKREIARRDETRSVATRPPGKHDDRFLSTLPCPALLLCPAQRSTLLQGVAESFQCRAFLLISISLPPLSFFHFFFFPRVSSSREDISWERVTRTWSNFNYTQRWRTRDIIVSLRNVGWTVGRLGKILRYEFEEDFPTMSFSYSWLINIGGRKSWNIYEEIMKISRAKFWKRILFPRICKYFIGFIILFINHSD